MIDVETLKHNVTSARGPFAGLPSVEAVQTCRNGDPGAWARWVPLGGPFGPQPPLRRPPCRRANSPRILPYHVHTPPCRALWITRGRFHRRQMRQSWASPIVFIAARPLPDGTTWDESRQGIGTAMYGPLFPLLHPDHWVPTTSIKLPLPHPPTKDPVLHQGRWEDSQPRP